MARRSLRSAPFPASREVRRGLYADGCGTLLFEHQTIKLRLRFQVRKPISDLHYTEILDDSLYHVFDKTFSLALLDFDLEPESLSGPTFQRLLALKPPSRFSYVSEGKRCIAEGREITIIQHGFENSWKCGIHTLKFPLVSSLKREQATEFINQFCMDLQTAIKAKEQAVASLNSLIAAK